MRRRIADIGGVVLRAREVLTRITHRAWHGARRGLVRGWAHLRLPVRRRAHLLDLTLQTRVQLAFVSVVTASTAIALFLQDSSLSSDLRLATRGRLERAATIAAQLLDDYAAVTTQRYEAIASTPQFLANLEAGDGPTLSHYAEELANRQGAVAIMFLDPSGNELAGVGDPELRAKARRRAAARGLDRGPEGRGGGAVVAYWDAPYSLVCLPVSDEAHRRGSLVAVEPISEEELAAWSRLCHAEVSIGRHVAGDDRWRSVRPVGGLQLRVFMTFDAEKAALANSRRNLITGGCLGLALALAVSIFLSRSLVRPIRSIQAAAERIGDGDLRIRLEDHRRDEVGDVARAINLMLDRLEENISHRIKVEHQVQRLAYHDVLTGLSNRQHVKEQLSEALEQSRRDEGLVAVIILDLDRFKGINDTLGHTAGDDLIREVARRLDSCLFGADTAETDRRTTHLARLGGDEFMVVLSDVRDHDEIREVAKLILDTLAEPFELRGRELAVGASLGIALAPDDADDVETLIKNSDLAMYHAKDQGGRCYEFYLDSMHTSAARKLALESRLQSALENDEFMLFYQPKIELASNQVTGVEALVRWRVDGENVASPAEFIPMAEETGDVVAIGDWVLRTAVDQAVAWQREGLPPVRVAVNVSARQIEHGEDFYRKVADLLEETGLEPGLLELEITESALLKNEDASIELFGRLRDMGIGLALDDFGTGYSSLSYLQRLPIDTLKIDRSFVQRTDSEPENVALVGAIITMAKILGLRVVVEGVETRKQRILMESLGCDEIQGFLFSRPLEPSEATGFLRKKRRRPNRKKTTKRAPRRSSRSPRTSRLDT